MQSNICAQCWQGTVVDGVCTACHRPAVPPEKRPRTALPILTVLNRRYMLGNVLGNGGFGITYSAWDRKENRRVAVKEFFPQKMAGRSTDRLTLIPVQGDESNFSLLEDRFRKEAMLLRQMVGMSNIIQVYDLFSANGTAYYAMEYLDGCDLNHYLKKNGPLSWEFLSPRLAEVLRTLDVLHRSNLIHRDISPDNLFLTRDGKLHLIDFGSVRTYQGNGNMTVMAKDRFTPFEQYQTNGKQGPWTDIYSMGVTIYQLLSGRLPPKAMEIINDKVQPIPLHTLRPDLPEQIVQAVEKAMKPLPSQRYQSVGEFLLALGIEPGPAAPARRQTDMPRPTAQPSSYRPGPPARSTAPPEPQSRMQGYWLCGIQGVYRGKRRMLACGRQILMGRGSGPEISFPANTPGISRRQCVLYIGPGRQLYVRDAGSSYGTFVNSERVGPGWVPVKPGSYLSFGTEVFRLMDQ